MTIKEEIKNLIKKAIKDLQIGGIPSSPEILVEAPKDVLHGDYSTNVAMVLAKQLGKAPAEIANAITSEINKSLIRSNEGYINFLEKVEAVGGFVNFYLTKEVFVENINNILENPKDYGKNPSTGSGQAKKIILDYTDPNPFKEFHIGHLMSNAIGESLSRIFEFQGAKVKRVCYQGDVGIHVAKAIWGKINGTKNLKWGQAYSFGTQAFEENENAKKEMINLNKIIYERTDKNINKLYDQGKKESLKYFDGIYKKLGTKFDWLIFESQVSDLGKKTVEKGVKLGVFEKGEDGAIIFKGEKFDPHMHTRVFINSKGIPTYEAKDLGLAQIKYKKFPYDFSFVVTGNEINEYFKVMKRAMQEILPDLAQKTFHIGHGMLRLPEGKMSSRTGKIITGEFLLEKLQEMVLEKIKDRNFSAKEKQQIAEAVSVGAIKYSVLKQTTGRDIIFDLGQSISFTGDSGAYLQYSYTRAMSVLKKAKLEKIPARIATQSVVGGKPSETFDLEKKLYQFPEVIEKASKEYQPHFIALYLTELASIFNAFYAENKIVDKNDQSSPYKIALTQAFTVIMKNGLWLLGITTLNKM